MADISITASAVIPSAAALARRRRAIAGAGRSGKARHGPASSCHRASCQKQRLGACGVVVVLHAYLDKLPVLGRCVGQGKRSEGFDLTGDVLDGKRSNRAVDRAAG